MTRLTAWHILRSGSSTPLRDVDRVADAHHVAALDRALLRRIIGTEVRRRTTLRAVLRHIAPANLNAELATHLHVALVQILFMDKIPEHAVRSECLDAVRRTLGPSKVRIAREVIVAAYEQLQQGRLGDPRRDLELRNAHMRDAVFQDPAVHPLLWAEDALSMPAPLLKRFVARFGEERAFGLARFALEEPPLSVRVVTGTREALAAELAGIETRPGVHDTVLLASASDAEAVSSSAAFVEGRATIQGESALRAAEAMEAREGEELLDLCAAPGGKTAVLAQGGARVVACDVSEEKLARVASTLERLKLREQVELVCSDGGAALGERKFDGVLVDAPCSNTGVLAQRPEARWRFSPKTKTELVALQTRLFERGASFVKPGGRIVWSTCALDSDENRRAVDAFLAAHAGWSLEEDAEALPGLDTTQQRGAGPIDGGYFARLRRAR